jgi:hypothetical protein
MGRGGIGGRSYPGPRDEYRSLDLVPIDHVVGGLVDIAERMPDASGRIFTLASGLSVRPHVRIRNGGSPRSMC